MIRIEELPTSLVSNKWKCDFKGCRRKARFTIEAYGKFKKVTPPIELIAACHQHTPDILIKILNMEELNWRKGAHNKDVQGSEEER